ncbi:hypothetical protein GGI15_000274 [Coemansia interrupta]|uniref:Uncharacterized protein n=1 Tax=Coemansia interrupta TaxID=1126814 RepID=A0A9W8LPN1_9FUNG|nr:hypothetical protein GGI15_000274 [Coemansia interrupta]
MAASVAQSAAIYYQPNGIKSQQPNSSKSTKPSPAAPATKPDPAVAMLTQILTPLKFVATSFLAGLEIQLEKADTKAFANVLRGPISDLKTYLASIWPTAPSANAPQPTTPGSKPPIPSSSSHK